MSHSERDETRSVRPRRGTLSRIVPVLILGLVVVAAAVMMLALLNESERTAFSPPSSEITTGSTKSADAPEGADDESTRSAETDDAASPPATAPAPEPDAAPPAPVEEAAVPAPGAGAPPPAANGGGELPYNVTEVYYATDRKRTGSTDPNTVYGGDRGDLVYGTVRVSIPKDHRVGELEAPSLMRFELTEKPEKHVVLLEVAERDRATFYTGIAERLAASPGRNAFIFVHGYNVSFRDAARRTAQMTYDLKFDGAPVFFSWPSQGSTLGYKYDEANVEWAQPDLKRFVKEFAQTAQADNLYLVAHSMGSRALTDAVRELLAEDPTFRSKIREIILAAPDIDADVFKRKIAPAFAGERNLVTLYASSKDWALTLSKTFNGYPRAGDSGAGLVVVPGIDTIEASDVDTDFLGHSYFMQSTSIISDLFHIIKRKVPPEQRPHLKSVTDANGSYWKIIRSEAATGDGN